MIIALVITGSLALTGVAGWVYNKWWKNKK